MLIVFPDFDETWPEYSSDINAKMVRCFNEIWNIFPVSFPELDDNNLVIS